MTDLRKQLAAAYWAFETPWEQYRKKTGDRRDASKCGDPKIAAAAKRFLVLMEQWEKEHPLDKARGDWWGMGPDGPVVFFNRESKSE